jgi:hypothetical protein
MFGRKVFYSRILVIGVLGAFLLFALPVAPFAQIKAAPPPSASLVGFVYAKDMKTPVRNAVVKLRNIVKGTDYESGPSDANGMYAISGIEEGRYIMGVTAQNGNYNFYYSLLLKNNEIAKLSVALNEGGGGGAGAAAGQDAEHASFFTSPAGVVSLVVVVGAVLYAVFASKEEASPVIR